MSHRTPSAVLNRVLKATGWFSAPSTLRRSACALAKVALVVILLLSLSPRSAAQTNCVRPPSGLISWWPGNGNALGLDANEPDRNWSAWT